MVFGGDNEAPNRRSLRPEGPKIEAEGRGRGGVLGRGRLLAHFSLKIMTLGGNNFDNFFLGINTIIYKF